MTNMKPGMLKYMYGEAVDTLNDAHKLHDEDETSYKESAEFFINTYAQQHDQAGPCAAEFIEALPSHPDRLQNALLGLAILRQTHEAIQEILELDAEFKKSLNNHDDFTPELDKHVKQDAKDFDRHHGNDKKDAVREQVVREEEIAARDVCDSAYDGNSAEIESNVNASMRDKLDGEGDVTLPIQHQKNTEEEDEDESLEEETITIKVPDYAGKPPSIAFSQSLQWLSTYITAVAAGSMAEHKFPRIEPLIIDPNTLAELDKPFTTTLSELTILRTAIRRNIRKIKPPMSESGGEIDAFFSNLDPDSPSTQHLKDMLGQLGQQFKKENEGEDWKNA